VHAIHAASDSAIAHSQPHDLAPRHPTLVLATCILASSLAFIDGSVVNVGLPAIGRSLSADAAGLQSIVDTYLLPLSALLLLGGAAGDRFGRRRLLTLGIALFAAASFLCTLAPGLTALLAGRLLQGVGAAMLMPNSLAILGATFTGAAKGRAVGTWAATGAAALALGPVLGGWLIDIASWRAIFLINLPVAAAAILLARRAIPPDTAPDGAPLDWRGGLLAMAGLGSLTWALTLGAGPAGWTSTAVATLAAAILLLALFLLAEHARGPTAMMPLALFASRDFIGITLLTLLLYGTMGGLFVLLPYLLIEAAHYAATSAGAALLPMPIILAIASPFMGNLAGRIGSRLPLSIGPLIVATGLLLTLRIGPTAAYVRDVLPAILVTALGISCSAAPLTTAVLNSVDPRHTGSASGFNSAVARSGTLIAIALLGSVLAARGQDLVDAFHTTALIGAATCVAASVSAFTLIRQKQKRSGALPLDQAGAERPQTPIH
jgi:EmrB/QacA subfamily drug resistance transporter